MKNARLKISALPIVSHLKFLTAAQTGSLSKPKKGRRKKNTIAPDGYNEREVKWDVNRTGNKIFISKFQLEVNS